MSLPLLGPGCASRRSPEAQRYIGQYSYDWEESEGSPFRSYGSMQIEPEGRWHAREGTTGLCRGTGGCVWACCYLSNLRPQREDQRGRWRARQGEIVLRRPFLAPQRLVLVREGEAVWLLEEETLGEICAAPQDARWAALWRRPVDPSFEAPSLDAACAARPPPAP